MVWSIRIKFLLTFIVGVMITFAAAMLVSYVSVDSAYMNLNERIINAEFDQISGEVEMILSETEALITTRVSGNVSQVVKYQEGYTPELITVIREMSEEVNDIINNFSHIDSVYLYMFDEWFLAMSDVNTRRFWERGDDWLSPYIVDLLAGADVSWQVAGDVHGDDFPLDMGEPAYLMMYKRLFSAYGEIVCLVNIKESELFDKYSGFMEDGVRLIRILNRDGVIISSADKSEIGTVFEVLKGQELMESGVLKADGMMNSYQPIEKYGLVMVNSVPVSVYTEELSTIRNLMLYVFFLGMMALSVFFSYWIVKRLKPIEAIRVGMRKAGSGDYSHQLLVEGSDELAELTENYNNMLVDLQELNEKRKLAENELLERELAMLRNEINPHFLYNTLNTIKCMADLEGNRDIARCVMALGGIVAPLYKATGYTWSLSEELVLVQKYMEIMNIRYQNGISCVFNVPEELLDRQIMRFIMQPIMENSILHGFEERAYSGQIILTVEAREGTLDIIIEDDGKGMASAELEKFNTALRLGAETGGVGILNVSRRIKLRYGAEYGVQMMPSVQGGLRTHIHLPEIS